MPNIMEIVNDLNLLIADIETVQTDNLENVDLKRAVGQLKAARTSIVRAKSSVDVKGGK